MQRKTFTRTLLTLSAVATLAAALPLAAQAQAMKLTLGHGAAVGNPRHEASVKFAEVLKAKSAGRIEVRRVARQTASLSRKPVDGVAPNAPPRGADANRCHGCLTPHPSGGCRSSLLANPR
mgnify:CR=1 FL=1